MEILVYIGRFQPFHEGHQETILKALETGNRLIIVLGSADSPPTVKNPFTAQQRQYMIANSDKIRNHWNHDLHFIYQNDNLYSDVKWSASLAKQVKALNPDNAPVKVIGYNKDSSSYYLNNFDWKFEEYVSDQFKNIDATNIRNPYLQQGKISGPIPDSTRDFLRNFFNTDDWDNLNAEYLAMTEYEEKYQTVPYTVNFLTVDCVVIQNGHILLIKRGNSPGKGLWALVGGHVNGDETCRQAAIRELREETHIKVSVKVLQGSIIDEKMFDHPERSLRCRVKTKKGRTVTVAYVIKLDGVDKNLPEIRGSDDAVDAKWVPIEDIEKMQLFEDHKHIIEWAVSRV